MALPLASTLLTIDRQEPTDNDVDADSETDYTTTAAPWVNVATNVRAVVLGPTGNRTYGAGGELERVTYPLRCDPCPVQGDDRVTDSNGQVYHVLWTRSRSALGISFVEGEVYQQTGESR